MCIYQFFSFVFDLSRDVVRVIAVHVLPLPSGRPRVISHAVGRGALVYPGTPNIVVPSSIPH